MEEDERDRGKERAIEEAELIAALAARGADMDVAREIEIAVNLARSMFKGLMGYTRTLPPGFVLTDKMLCYALASLQVEVIRFLLQHGWVDRGEEGAR